MNLDLTDILPKVFRLVVFSLLLFYSFLRQETYLQCGSGVIGAFCWYWYGWKTSVNTKMVVVTLCTYIWPRKYFYNQFESIAELDESYEAIADLTLRYVIANEDDLLQSWYREVIRLVDDHYTTFTSLCWKFKTFVKGEKSIVTVQGSRQNRNDVNMNGEEFKWDLLTFDEEGRNTKPIVYK